MPPPTHIPGGVWGACLIVFVVALAVRGVYLWQMRDSPFFNVLIGDARHYDAWASEIAGGDLRAGDMVFWQAPLYQYFLGGVYAAVGRDVWLVRLLQIALGASTSSLVVWTGRNFFDLPTGLAAGLLLALAPDAIYFDGLVQKAVLDLWLTALFLGFLGSFLVRPRWWNILAAGAALGVLIANRENARLLAPVVAVWIWWMYGDHTRTERARWTAALALGIVAPLVPIALRNYDVGGQFVVTSTGLGHNFYIGNNPEATGTYAPVVPGRADPMFEPLDVRQVAEEAVGRTLTPREVSNYWLSRAWEFIRTEPGAWLRLMLHKWRLVWSSASMADSESIDAFQDDSTLLRATNHLLHFGVLTPLAVLGIWATRRDWRRLTILYVSLFLLAASIAAFFVFARYRASMLPLLALFSGAGIVAVMATVRRRGVVSALREQRSGLALAALVAVYCNWPITTEKITAEEMRQLSYRNYAQVHGTMGLYAQRDGDRRRAVQYYHWALRLYPAHLIPEAAANLAWILATAPEDDLRNGAEAVEWVDQLGTIGTVDDPVLLDVMAAAYAAGGRFADATDTARRALALAEAQGNREQALAIGARLAEYARAQAVVVTASEPPFPGAPPPADAHLPGGRIRQP